MRITLLITVDDLAGYQQGLPALLNLLDEYKIQANICLSLGFDNSGLMLKRLYKPRELSRYLPFRQKLLGTLLPPVNLAKRFKNTLLALADTNHQLGVGSFDAINWQLTALDADQAWTRQQMQWSQQAFEELFGRQPEIHHASGFVVNKYMFLQQAHAGFQIAVDARGKTPFYPSYHEIHSHVLQLPVTLPSIEELLCQDEVNEDNVHEYLLVESQKQLPQGHIMHVRASHEGRQWLGIVEKMIVMWRSLNWEFCQLTEVRDYLRSQNIQPLTHQLGWAEYPPGKRYLATQGLMEDDIDQAAT